MQAYVMTVASDGAGPYAVIGIYPDGPLPKAAASPMAPPVPTPVPQPVPLSQLTIRPQREDYAGTDAMKPADRLAHVAAAMVSRGMTEARSRAADLAAQAALTTAAAAFIGKAYPL